jgi:hypothetical protein
MWRLSQRRVLKTATDYADMIAWGAQRASRKTVGIKAHNRLPPLAVAAMLAAVHGVLGIEKTRHSTISDVWTALCHVPVTVTTVKNAKRRGAGPDRLEGSIDRLSKEDEEFAAALFRWRVETLDLLVRLCSPGSEAEARVWNVFDRTMLIGQASRGEPDFEPDFEPDALECILTEPHIAREDASSLFVNSMYSEKQSDCFQKGPKIDASVANDTSQQNQGLKDPRETTAFEGVVCYNMPNGANDTKIAAPPETAGEDGPGPARGVLAVLHSPSETTTQSGAESTPGCAPGVAPPAVALSIASARFGLAATGSRYGEAELADIVDQAAGVFPRPGGLRLFAEELGRSVAELRSELEPVLARRLRAQGLSPTAARKAAAHSARQEPVVLIIAAVSRFPTAAVVAALARAAAKLGAQN